jgi:hypothetical protein
MPAVVTYWWLLEEEDEFLDYLARSGEVVAMPDAWMDSPEELAAMPVDRYIRECDPVQLLFGLSQHLANVPIRPRTHHGRAMYSGPNAMESCAISYSRGRLKDSTILTQFNLAAYWQIWSTGPDTGGDKDPAFVKWGKNVFAWVRRKTPERHQYKQYRVSRRAKQALEKGLIQLVPY